MDDLDLTDKISTPEGRLLAEVVGRADPAPGLWELVETGAAAQWLPELPALRLEQDPLHRHKDVLAHTIAVVAKAPARLRVRLGALFHDVGKPRTRSFEHGGVTFRHHEVVGARMTRKPAVAMVTAGPGFTNALTGIASARLANAPVILISGCVGLESAEKLDLQDMT